MAKKRATRKKASRSNVSAEDFCAAWAKVAKNEGTVDDVATALGMNKNAVIARRNNYTTGLGLKFPKLRRANAGPRLDKTALQKILNG